MRSRIAITFDEDTTPTKDSSLREILNVAEKLVNKIKILDALKDKKEVTRIQKKLNRYLYLINKSITNPAAIDDYDLAKEFTTVITNHSGMEPVENPTLAPFRLQVAFVQCRQRLLVGLEHSKVDPDDKILAEALLEKIDGALRQYDRFYKTNGLDILKQQVDLIELWISQEKAKKSFTKPHSKNKGLAIMVGSLAQPVKFEKAKDIWHSFKIWVQTSRNKTPKYEHAVQQRQTHEHRETIRHELDRCLNELANLSRDTFYPAIRQFGSLNPKKLSKKLSKLEVRIRKELQARPIEKDKHGYSVILDDIGNADTTGKLLEVRKRFEHRHRWLMPTLRSLHRLQKAVEEANGQLKQLGKLGIAWNEARRKPINVPGIKKFTKVCRDIGNLSNIFDNLIVGEDSIHYGTLTSECLQGFKALLPQLREFDQIESALTSREAALKAEHIKKEPVAELIEAALVSKVDEAQVVGLGCEKPGIEEAGFEGATSKTPKHTLIFHPRRAARLVAQGIFKTSQSVPLLQCQEDTQTLSDLVNQGMFKTTQFVSQQPDPSYDLYDSEDETLGC